MLYQLNSSFFLLCLLPKLRNRISNWANSSYLRLSMKVITLRSRLVWQTSQMFDYFSCMQQRRPWTTIFVLRPRRLQLQCLLAMRESAWSDCCSSPTMSAVSMFQRWHLGLQWSCPTSTGSNMSYASAHHWSNHSCCWYVSYYSCPFNNAAIISSVR
jgi:hypothetical protein